MIRPAHPTAWRADATIRNVTVFADAEVDRSPCGSGTQCPPGGATTRSALRRSATRLINAGITGEAFVARVEGTTTLGDRDAVVTSVQGRGFVTGHHSFVIDERDPLAAGFLLR